MLLVLKRTISITYDVGTMTFTAHLHLCKDEVIGLDQTKTHIKVRTVETVLLNTQNIIMLKLMSKKIFTILRSFFVFVYLNLCFSTRCVFKCTAKSTLFLIELILVQVQP